MKKPITLLIAISLIGLSGCSNAKLSIRAKGVRINTTEFEAELLSKIDNFRANNPFVVSGDVEDLKADYVFEDSEVEKTNAIRTTAGGRSETVRNSMKSYDVSKYDYDNERMTYVEKEKYSIKEGDRKGSQVANYNYTYSDLYKYDNLSMTMQDNSLEDVRATFISGISDLVSEINDVYNQCLAAYFSSNDAEAYKLGNTYTIYAEINAADMLSGATGKAVEIIQYTVTNKSFEYTASEKYSDLAYVKDGFKTRGSGYYVVNRKLAKKNVRITSPKASKYALISE